MRQRRTQALRVWSPIRKAWRLHHHEVVHAFLLPYVITNVLGIALVVLAWRRPGLTRGVLASGFVAAALVNMHGALTDPDAYFAFARFAIAPYPWLIEHVFAVAPVVFLIAIAIVQLAGAIMIAFGNRAIARVGGMLLIAFLVAIAPFGYGSAFPAPLLFAVVVARVCTSVPVRSPFARLHRAA